MMAIFKITSRLTISRMCESVLKKARNGLGRRADSLCWSVGTGKKQSAAGVCGYCTGIVVLEFGERMN